LRYFADSRTIKNQWSELIISGSILIVYVVISLIEKSASIVFLTIMGTIFIRSVFMIVLGKAAQKYFKETKAEPDTLGFF